jgi:hypothetical protein
MSDVVAPDAWDGPLHERPGLFNRRWQDAHPDPVGAGAELVAETGVRPAHPAPTLLAEALPEDQAGRTVRTVLNRLSPGWGYTLTRSRGHRMLERTPWVGKQSDLVVLRLGHTDGRRLAGAWLDGGWSEGWAWRVCADPGCAWAAREHAEDTPRPINGRELPELVGPDWAALSDLSGEDGAVAS